MRNIKNEKDMYFWRSFETNSTIQRMSLTSRGLPFLLSQDDIVYIRCHADSIPRKNIPHNKCFVIYIIYAYSRLFSHSNGMSS